MELAQTATLMPGQCLFCLTADGPFLDTYREGDRGRIYFCLGCVQAFANAALIVPELPKESLLVRELKALRERHAALLEAVHLTLTEGVAIRHGKVALRSQRGRKGFELELPENDG